MMEKNTVYLFYTRRTEIPEREYPISEYRENRMTGKEERDAQLRIPEILLIRALQELGFAPELPLRIEVNDFGKPILKSVPVCFSISHSGELVMLAVSERNVGLDIQEGVKKNLSLRVAERRLHPAERDFILKDENPEDAFVRVWTRKEAYLKYIGTGLQTSLISFSALEPKDGFAYYDGVLEGMRYAVCASEESCLVPPEYIKL